MKRVLRTSVAVAAAVVLGTWIGNSAGPAFAYTLLGGTACGQSQITYKINPDFGNPGAGSTQDQINAVSAGASEWYNQTATPLQFVYGGTTSTTMVATDTENVVFVRHEQPGDRVAEAYRWVIGGWECRFDIIFFDGWPFAVNPGGSTIDIQSVAAHEFGHALGLDHSADTSAVMYAASYYDSTWGRTLNHDDVDGAEWLNGWRYGNGYHLEGLTAYVYDADGGGDRVPLYRLYRGGPEDHFLSLNPAEASGYTNEGVVGYVYSWQPADHIPLYRLYKSGHHLSTKDENERAAAMGTGWILEGSTGYVLANPVSGTHALNRFHNVRYADYLY